MIVAMDTTTEVVTFIAVDMTKPMTVTGDMAMRMTKSMTMSMIVTIICDL